jgi:hypothetical protein
MLFWACEANLLASENPSDRKYPFRLLKDVKHDYATLKTAFPNSKCKLLVRQVLRNHYRPPTGHPDTTAQFEHLCDVFELMYVSITLCCFCRVNFSFPSGLPQILIIA